MKTFNILGACLAVICPASLMFAQNINVLSAQEKLEGWNLLFDGKTLNGWHPQVPPPPREQKGGGATTKQANPAPRPGALPAEGSSPNACVTPEGKAAQPAGASHWEVIDGLLTPCGDPGGHLVSDGSYGNFVLSVEFKCGEDTNSGVYIRSPNGDGGYEVQIWRQQAAGYNTGAIVGTAKTDRDFNFKPDEWNHLEITANGDHLVVVLNGETTVDVRDNKFTQGNIRLQYHKFPMAFRNVKIKALR